MNGPRIEGRCTTGSWPLTGLAVVLVVVGSTCVAADAAAPAPSNYCVGSGPGSVHVILDANVYFE